MLLGLWWDTNILHGLEKAKFWQRFGFLSCARNGVEYERGIFIKVRGIMQDGLMSYMNYGTSTLQKRC